MIPLGTYPFVQKLNVVPGSDGAGTVLAIGRSVTKFRPGDKVITMLLSKFAAGSVDTGMSNFTLGGSVDGTLRTVGSFEEDALVKMPEGLSFTEAATLSCAGVTAWNALFGLIGKQLKAGQWVLTQGTGGVSLFAVQFAKAVGAKVIATTSSNEKTKLLQSLGADHVLNYHDEAEWGRKAKAMTRDGAGVDLVVEVGGPATLRQSVASLKPDGTISVVGAVGRITEDSNIPNLLDPWLNNYTVRGIHVGSRAQMEDMAQAIEANLDKLRPVVDSKLWKLEELKEAYKYLQDGKHTGKICIEIA